MPTISARHARKKLTQICYPFSGSLVFALRPELIPTLYSALALYFLPLRVWSYTSKKWHYFLFDFCYFLNVANLLFIWVFPNSEFLFTVCYCAAHGPLASASQPGETVSIMLTHRQTNKTC